jgi:hypothetical protein
MMIEASGRFVCRHQYRAVPAGDGARFVCDACGHRTETLPLQRSTTFGLIVRFPPALSASLHTLPASALESPVEETQR